MTFFKVIENGEAVDAGWMWLRWNTKHGCLLACEPREAHYAQNYTETAIYRIGWLNPLPEGAPTYPMAEASIIDAQEYDDLLAALDGDETVPEPVDPEPTPEPDPAPDPAPEPERPMSIAEMRAKIAELTSMAAKDNIQMDAFFVLHDEVYQATRPIVKGTEIRPGYNCVKKTLDDLY